ncbi:MAG: hypothetical protein KGL19_00230 [Bacteroidota bacterium]|nr:hypothetical protein [Bacteroidota bacterium]
MEVHHHPQVEKKSFKEYFLEFLMIFLAVTMGFFAENYREHLAEVNKENDYIQTFIEDLKTDTTKIKQLLYIERSLKLKAIDSLLFLMCTHQIKGHENDLYYFGRIVTRYPIFQSNDRTVTELKNSGSLRLIRNEATADSIISYQKAVEEIYTVQDDENAERKDLYPILCRMYDPFIFDKMAEGFKIIRPNDNPPLRSYDTNIQKDLAFYISEIKGSDNLVIRNLQNLETKAENVIAFLQKKYY